MRHFYPRSPCGERLGCQRGSGSALSISIHALLAESDFCAPKMAKNSITISIHALLAESDAVPRLPMAAQPQFLSTLSLRRATSSRIRSSSIITYFYPRSPCGERQPSIQFQHPLKSISIHALLAESDLFKNHIIFCHSLFLSTLSLRRATALILANTMLNAYFYPRSPCGERP